MKINVSDFWLYLYKICERHRLNFIFFNYDEALDPVLFTNQKLLNILAAFRTFDDHVGHQLSTVYGTESNEFKLYKSISSKIFDGNFSYRFFCKLRNYTQHFGLPIRSVAFQTRSENSKFSTALFSVTPLIRKNDLLSYKDWGKITKEIEELEEKIDIREHVNEFYYSLQKIYKEIQQVLEIKYYRSKLIIDQLYQECLSKIEDDKSRYDTLSLGVYIASNNKNEKKPLSIMLPIDIIRRIEKYKLKNIYKDENSDTCSFLHSFDELPI